MSFPNFGTNKKYFEIRRFISSHITCSLLRVKKKKYRILLLTLIHSLLVGQNYKTLLFDTWIQTWVIWQNNCGYENCQCRTLILDPISMNFWQVLITVILFIILFRKKGTLSGVAQISFTQSSNNLFAFFFNVSETKFDDTFIFLF